jgi:hypothetical protein
MEAAMIRICCLMAVCSFVFGALAQTPPKTIDGTTVEHTGERDLTAAEVWLNFAETTPLDVVSARQRTVSNFSTSQFGLFRDANLRIVGSFNSQFMVAGNFNSDFDPTYSDRLMEDYLRRANVQNVSEVQGGERFDSRFGRHRTVRLKVGNSPCVFGYSWYDFSQSQNFNEYIWDTRLTILICDGTTTTADLRQIFVNTKRVDVAANQAALARRPAQASTAPAAAPSAPAAVTPGPTGERYCARGPLVFRDAVCTSGMEMISKEEYERRLVTAQQRQPPAPGATTPAAADDKSGSVEQRLSRLRDMLQRGLITEQEAARRREEILKDL